jgi:hypothetical protein
VTLFQDHLGIYHIGHFRDLGIELPATILPPLASKPTPVAKKEKTQGPPERQDAGDNPSTGNVFFFFCSNMDSVQGRPGYRGLRYPFQ